MKEGGEGRKAKAKHCSLYFPLLCSVSKAFSKEERGSNELLFASHRKLNISLFIPTEELRILRNTSFLFCRLVQKWI